jgi:hypothetical protein
MSFCILMRQYRVTVCPLRPHAEALLPDKSVVTCLDPVFNVEDLDLALCRSTARRLCCCTLFAESRQDDEIG